MVGMGIDGLYQNEVKGVCISSTGDFRGTPIKGYVRMTNKLMSKNDHYYEMWPRPGLNSDKTATAAPPKP